MSYQILIDKPALKFIAKQTPAQRKRILEAIARLPDSGDRKAMAGHLEEYRLRVGSYRVLYTVDSGILTVRVLNAGKSGIAEPTIRRYELGSLNPKIETLKKIADALELSVDFVIGREPFSDLAALELLKPSIVGQLYVNGFCKDNVDTFEFYRLSDKHLLGISEMPNGQTKLSFKNPLQFEDHAFSSKSDKLLKQFYALNDDGQSVAVERVQELTQIPKYQKQQPAPQATQTATEGKEADKP